MRGRGPPGEGEVPQGSVAGAGSLPDLQVAGFLLCYLQNGPGSKYSHIRGVKALTYEFWGTQLSL